MQYQVAARQRAGLLRLNNVSGKVACLLQVTVISEYELCTSESVIGIPLGPQAGHLKDRELKVGFGG